MIITSAQVLNHGSYVRFLDRTKSVDVGLKRFPEPKHVFRKRFGKSLRENPSKKNRNISKKKTISKKKHLEENIEEKQLEEKNLKKSISKKKVSKKISRKKSRGKKLSMWV